jgi:hypothetical protein
MRKVCFVFCLISGLVITNGTYAQSQVKGYLSFIIPWVTVQGKVTTPEFKTATTIGFPFGVMVLCAFRSRPHVQVQAWLDFHPPPGL